MSRQLPIAEVALGTGLAIVTAVGAIFLFVTLSQPAGARARMAAVRQQTDTAQALLAAGGRATVYPRGSLCTSIRAAPAELIARVQAAAARTGVTLTRPQVQTGGPQADAGGLTPVALTFEAEGSYEGVVGLLGELSAGGPRLFADTVDLKSQVSSVSLAFTGRIYCSPAARS